MKTSARESNDRLRSGRNLCVCATAALLWLLSSPAGAAEGLKRVVVLYPVSDGQPGITAFDQGFRSTLKTLSHRDDIEIYNEYLDTARFADRDHQRRLAKFLREKYADRRIDVVVTALAPSLDFLLRFRDELFPDATAIYAAVERREVESRRLAGFVGAPMRIDLEGTLEAALRLHPGTRRVVVVAGKGKTDAYWVAEAKRAFQGRAEGVEFEYWVGRPMEELLREAARLPKDAIIYYLNCFEDGRGRTYVPAEVAERLCGSSNVPVYGHFRSYLGRGVVGGRMVGFEVEGEKAARLASRALAGEDLGAIERANVDDPSYAFDWRQLQRWGIREEELPEGSLVLFKPPSFWEMYRWRIIGILSLCVVEAVLIVALMMERARRRRADRQFRQAVVAAPCGMILVAPSGEIVLANPHSEALFGYGPGELIGLGVDSLVPEQVRDGHRALREGYLTSPSGRPMGIGRKLFGRRKDGSEFPVEIALNPIASNTSTVILASIIDITERRRTEEDLRAGQRELRELTGRLLLAQETERRRIARELHDDLSQGLALLAVHLELLSSPPKQSGNPIGEELRDLSARVRQLSSSVHDLSTLLHPSKLEQLGLVPAVKSLCRELAHNHGLAIDLVDEPMASRIPQETALCLYRIAQEALGNVIKHSGAEQARVELGPEGDGAYLRIIDDGSGFDVHRPGFKAGLGLISMRERLLLADGRISIDSRPGSGTRVTVFVPLPPSGTVVVAEPEAPTVPGTALLG